MIVNLILMQIRINSKKGIIIEGEIMILITFMILIVNLNIKIINLFYKIRLKKIQINFRISWDFSGLMRT